MLTFNDESDSTSRLIQPFSRMPIEQDVALTEVTSRESDPVLFRSSLLDHPLLERQWF
jgi:hypothetical protein